MGGENLGGMPPGCELYCELSVNFKMALWGGVAAILCTSVNSIVNSIVNFM